MPGTLHIGRPPTAPHRPRRRPWVLWACIGLVALALIAGGAFYGVAMARHDNAEPDGFAAWPLPPSPSSNAVNEALTCGYMVPLLHDGVTEMNAILDDPSRSTIKAATTAGQLKALVPAAPAYWRADIEAQYKALEQIADAHGDLGRIAAIDEAAYGDSGVRLAQGCRPYATS